MRWKLEKNWISTWSFRWSAINWCKIQNAKQILWTDEIFGYHLLLYWNGYFKVLYIFKRNKMHFIIFSVVALKLIYRYFHTFFSDECITFRWSSCAYSFYRNSAWFTILASAILSMGYYKNFMRSIHIFVSRSMRFVHKCCDFFGIH